MVKIKICGVTNVSDALQAAELGADALGLNFFKSSPRYVTPEMAAEIVRELPAIVETFGVFVNEPSGHIKRVVSQVGLRNVQWHGEHIHPNKDYNFNDLRKELLKQRSDIGKPVSWGYPNLLTPDEKTAEREWYDHWIRTIDAMTEEERVQPDLIGSQRRQEIAQASGVRQRQVKQLLTEFFNQARKYRRMSAALSLWQKVKMVFNCLGQVDHLQQAAAGQGISGVILPAEVQPAPLTHAFGVKDKESLELVAKYLEVCSAQGQLPAAILVDAHVPGSFGGTGQTLPWELLADFSPGVPLILAGGLNSDNVARAIRLVRPYAVDVASGVESEPGKKDVDKMKKFIDAVRLAV